MNTIRDFVTKSREICLYINYIKANKSINQDIHKILRANCFIMLYNLIESVVTNAFEEIYQAYALHDFDKLKADIRKIILKNIKDCDPQELVVAMTTISKDIILSSFKKEKMFSGNLDAREIKNTTTKYKISKTFDYKNDNLLTIKTNRNDLGHGVKSFAECGRDYTMDDIELFALSTFKFLRKFLRDVESHISNREFLI